MSLIIEETDDWYQVVDEEDVIAQFVEYEDARDFVYLKNHSGVR